MPRKALNTNALNDDVPIRNTDEDDVPLLQMENELGM